MQQDMTGDSATIPDAAPLNDFTIDRGESRSFIRFPGNSMPEKFDSESKQQLRNIPLEVKREATNGNIIYPNGAAYSENSGLRSIPAVRPKMKSDSPEKLRLKKTKPAREGRIDMPPTPWGCEWREVEDGWNLWRYWTDKDRDTGDRIKKERYLGSLSRDAWEVMKGYDNETIISNIGKRFRGYGRS